MDAGEEAKEGERNTEIICIIKTFVWEHFYLEWNNLVRYLSFFHLSFPARRSLSPYYNASLSPSFSSRSAHC